jgi:uncharacterized protein YbjT (DUF2867 family)
MIGRIPTRVLVVGGTGHTGERLARRLLRIAMSVRVLTRNPQGEVARALAREGCEIATGDCTRRWTLWEAVDGCDAVASCAHIKHAGAVVQAALRHRVERAVFMSSTRRFSQVPDDTVRQVIEGERAITESALEWTIVRCNMIYGGARDNNLEKVVRWMRARVWFPVVGNGRNLVQPVFTEDVVSAMQEALRRPEVASRREYTLAGPRAMEYDQMLRLVATALGREIRLIHFPLPVAMACLRLGRPVLAPLGVNDAMLRRFSEDKAFDFADAARDLGFLPHDFATALALKVSGQAEPDAIYARSSSAVHLEEGDAEY